MVDTPKLPFPVISEQATVRIKLGLLVAIIISIAGGSAWMTNVHNDNARMESRVNEVLEWTHSFDRRLGNVEEVLGLPRRNRIDDYGPPNGGSSNGPSATGKATP